jgi:hypothetical protein
VDALDKWIIKDALKSAKVPKPYILRNNLNPNISTYGNADCQQTHAEFKPNIGDQHVSDQGPNDCEEETANDIDELKGVDGLKRRWTQE